MLSQGENVIPNLFAHYRSHDKIDNFIYKEGKILIFVMLPMNWWKSLKAFRV